MLMLYGIENSPFNAELIKCIRYCAVGVIAASVGAFLSDYYGDIEKPFRSCIMVVFRIAVFPILLCVAFSLEGIENERLSYNVLMACNSNTIRLQ